MKNGKLFALATALAIAVMAIGFSSSALAAKTCSTSGTGTACAAGHGNQLTTQAFSASSEGQNWSLTSGFITVKCESQIGGEVSHEGNGKITSWTFSNCTSSLGSCPSAQVNASPTNPYPVTATSSGAGNGSLRITGSPVTLVYPCAGVTCRYTTTEMGGSNGAITVTGGEPGRMTWSSIAATKEEGSSGFCSSVETLEGSFTVTSPTSLWIE